MKLLTVILLTVVVVGIVIVSTTSADSDSTATSATNGVNKQRKSHLPKLFDFEHYKKVFKKKYASLREELVRRKIVLAKAFRAFVSGIAYKFKRSNFYLAINQGSDQTPEEFNESLPKVKPLRNLDPTEEAQSNSVKPVVAPKLELADEEAIEQGLEEIKKIAKEQNDPILATVTEELDGTKTRSKRSTYAKSSTRTDFSLDNLLKAPEPPRKQKANTLESNNPDYEPPEITSFGLDGPEEKPMSEDLISEVLSDDKEEKAEENATVQNYLAYLFGLTPVNPLKPEEAEIEDIRFVDHSVSSCMPQVTSQGRCGSCYAFAMTAVFSWLLCQETDVSIAFSDQYIVDCGPETELKKDVNGCDGGFPEYGGKYFERYGVELASNYPYVGRQGTCPYDNVQDNRKMGFIRFNPGTGSALFVDYKYFEQQLKLSPMVIAIGFGGSMKDYGGGVFDGANCCKEEGPNCGEHAVVLVGHGSENGEDYWIIRNSHGTSYGENGYLRLRKSADCIQPRYGIIYSYLKGYGNLPLAPRRNVFRPDEIELKIRDRSRYLGPLQSFIRQMAGTTDKL